jgi:hypothetical protein
MAPPSALALQIARTRVGTRTDRHGNVYVTVCDGASPAWATSYPPGPDQAQLVASHQEQDACTVARFVQMGIDAVTAERDALKHQRDVLREAARALLNSLPYHTPACPFCPGRVMATKAAALKPPFAGIRFTCDAHAQEGDEARDLETSAQVRALRALLGGDR